MSKEVFSIALNFVLERKSQNNATIVILNARKKEETCVDGKTQAVTNAVRNKTVLLI